MELSTAVRIPCFLTFPSVLQNCVKFVNRLVIYDSKKVNLAVSCLIKKYENFEEKDNAK